MIIYNKYTKRVLEELLNKLSENEFDDENDTQIINSIITKQTTESNDNSNYFDKIIYFHEIQDMSADTMYDMAIMLYNSDVVDIQTYNLLANTALCKFSQEILKILEY